MANIQEINFANFSPEILTAIQNSARTGRQFGCRSVTACLLLGGLAMVNGREVCNVLDYLGFDPNESMDAIAEGMIQSAAYANDSDGDGFDDDVVEALKEASNSSTAVDIITMVNALVDKSMRSLAHYLRPKTAHLDANAAPPANDELDPLRDAANVNTDNLPDLDMEIESLHAGSQPDGPREESAPHARRENANREVPTTNGPTVRKHCINMLEVASKGKYHDAIGREKELDRVLMILARSTKNNPVLVGEPGTGKTAIVEDFAIKLYYGEVPESLMNLKLYSLDFTALKALPNAVEVLKKILEECEHDPTLVLFIDEIHMLISKSSASDNDVANLLKPAMARGEIKLIGATTIEEYKIIEKDPAFERRFQPVTVNEPDIESAIKIITGGKGRYEAHHQLSISDEVCKAAVNLSARYITSRKLPDKAFDLIDEAAANVRLKEKPRNVLEVNDIKKVITEWTGIPVDDIGENETERLQNIEEHLHASVVGQEKAIKAVSDAIRRSRMGFGDQNRPIGSFLFLGTTGTGKTELCKAVAQFLFRDRNKMVRIDMSEYQEPHSVSRLIGAPPGYVGFEQGGQLTEAIRRKPYSVVLFDEIEKAHPKIFESLLQVLDDGRLTDGQGKTVDFKNTLIVMTSNMGQQTILNALCGQDVSDAEIERCTEEVMHTMRQRLAPEFVNRIDQVVMFLPLTREDISKIADIHLNNEKKKLHEKEIEIVIEPSAKEFIVAQGYVPEFGGRPVKRAIIDHIINPLTNAIVSRAISKDQTIYIYSDNNKIEFRNVASGRI